MTRDDILAIAATLSDLARGRRRRCCRQGRAKGLCPRMDADGRWTGNLLALQPK